MKLYIILITQTIILSEHIKFESPPTEGTPPTGSGPISGQLALSLQSTNQPEYIKNGLCLLLHAKKV